MVKTTSKNEHDYTETSLNETALNDIQATRSTISATDASLSSDENPTLPAIQDEGMEFMQDSRQQNAKVVSLDNINNIPVTLSAVLGKRKIDVASLLTLERGSILDIDKKIGDPIDLYVNDHLVARGELIMIDGGLGVSMTEIVQTENTNLITQNING